MRGARLIVLGIVLASACGDDVLPSPGGTGGTSGGGSGGGGSTGSVGGAASTGDLTTGGDSTGSDGGLAASSGDSSSGTGTGTGTESGTGTGTGTGTESGTGTGTGTESGTGTGTGTATLESTGSTPGPICVDIDLADALGLTLGDTTDLADDRDPPCVPGLGGSDAGHRFVAPADGFYTFDTAGSAFDTVLHAYAPDCEGTLIGCNDDSALGVLQARLPVYLGAAEEAVVVVDGWDDTQLGAYELDVSAVFDTCVDEDLGQVVSATIMGTTTGELDKLEPSCLPASGPDYVVRWVAPSNDVYRIRTTGSSFDTVLYVLPGECAGPPIACNDDTTPIELTSTVLVAPGFQQVVTIVVDGFDADEHGAFTLTVELL